jgi:hypothetical protein
VLRETLRDLESVDVRQLNIDEHEVGTVLLRPFDAADARFGFGHHEESVALEELTRGSAEVAVVVDEENTTGHEADRASARGDAQCGWPDSLSTR